MPTEFAAVRETHSGVVFLVGDRAYKLKKPVELGFLDFRTPERRLAACRRELELNRRLAPDVYLGIAELSGVDGCPDEPLLVMRRMPDDRRLSALVRAGVSTIDVIERLARLIAAFHASADRRKEISAEGGRDALRDRWTASFDQVRPLGVLEPAVAERIERLALDFLAGRRALFDRRIATGRIVDGHGDLLADDIFCLDDGPRVLDCLEFDDRLRWVDGLDDIAFLAMDLEHLGAEKLAEHLLDRYAEFAADPAPSSLRHHYLAYRAFVRAKVGCLRAGQGEASAAESAREYAALALQHLRAGQPRLILVGGLPGTGKSTVAGLLADRLGGVLLSSDRLRKELADRSPHDPAAAPYNTGIYTPEHTQRTYVELVRRAGELLEQGETVVLDASWNRARAREHATEIARHTSSELVALRCTAPIEITIRRLRERDGSFSDADPVIAAAMAADSQPWPNSVTLPTTGSPDDTLTRAMAAIDPPNTP
ncbi:AAA family ATPase [Amycolatopsis anabasis]|uniref:bifunctional aminoglycoside phosphotransferase/ATP-binding protein n=1 Tax=Amycolatopsis anabasis TaxID=1840409 RepID=UPI00131C1E92|nr:bifunctional aminoglycoside phosphotransferase/ATP-binding protein [Amycolatopsis anabasis]